MRFDVLRKQVAKLKEQMPKEIVIQLRDGSEYRHPGPVIDFVVQGLREGYLGKGLIREACLNSDQISISQNPRTRDQLVALIRCAGHFKGVTKENSEGAGTALFGAARPQRGANGVGYPAASVAPAQLEQHNEHNQ